MNTKLVLTQSTVNYINYGKGKYQWLDKCQSHEELRRALHEQILTDNPLSRSTYGVIS